MKISDLMVGDASLTDAIGGATTIKVKNEKERQYIENLDMDQRVTFKGKIRSLGYWTGLQLDDTILSY